MVYKRFGPDRFQHDVGMLNIGHTLVRPIGPNIDLCVWNICKAKYPNWSEDFEEVCFQQDIVLLQESVIGSLFDEKFSRSDDYSWVMAKTFSDRLNGYSTGVKTGAISAPMQCSYIASTHSEPIYGTKKMALLTSYRLADHDFSLLVINVHALNFVTNAKYELHMREIAAAIERHEGPAILAGDFNTWSRRRQEIFSDVTKQLLLIDAEIKRRPRMRHFGRHLDHIYYRGLFLCDSRVLQAVRSSDHYPLQLKFRIS